VYSSFQTTVIKLLKVKSGVWFYVASPTIRDHYLPSNTGERSPP